MRSTKHNYRLFLWPIALYLVISIFSHQSRLYVPPIPGLSHDKIIHALVFGLLATGFIRAVPQSKRSLIMLFFIILVTSLLGAIDEVHQSYVPGRFMEAGDLIADSIGAAIAVILYHNWRGYRKFLEYNFK